MGFLSDSSYHLQSEQTAFNRKTGKHSLNSACICHSQIANNKVILEWKGNIEKNLSFEYGFPSRTYLMGILCIHLKIYSPECTKSGETCAVLDYRFAALDLGFQKHAMLWKQKDTLQSKLRKDTIALRFKSNKSTQTQ